MSRSSRVSATFIRNVAQYAVVYGPIKLLMDALTAGRR